MRVLVLEDDPLLAGIWRDSVVACGFACTVFSSCEAAMDDALRGQHDLYLFDYFVQDGATGPLMALVRARHPDRPVVLITGSDEFAMGEHSGSAYGPNWVLRKPVRPADLQAIIKYLSGTLVAAEAPVQPTFRYAAS